MFLLMTKPQTQMAQTRLHSFPSDEDRIQPDGMWSNTKDVVDMSNS